VTELTVVQADRVTVTRIGLATGDALGPGYEFGRPPYREVRMIGGGLGGREPGEWADDTRWRSASIKQPRWEPRRTVRRRGVPRLVPLGPADVGIQTKAVLSGAASAADLPSRAACRTTTGHTSISANSVCGDRRNATPRLQNVTISYLASKLTSSPT
jgi:hypothetical protein